jgi:diguanylate cyclase (GGDEF)-like protein
MREQFPSANWQVTGLGMAIASSSRLLTQGQIQSLMLTLAIIFCIMLIFFMSFKVGWISILPNMIPIVINFGVMGWLGIELSMVTSLIASIAIGMAVDDIIHYLVRYNQKFKTLMDKKLALENTLKHIGNQMIFSSIAVCAGFFVLAFSSFRATAIFGIMMVIIMLSGLFADIVLLPSLMLHVELVTLWDLIRIKMGKDPEKGIPLFSGLRKTQIQALMMASALRKIEAGQVLFHKGEASDFMYAIVSGAFDVLDPVTAAGNCGNPGLWKRIAHLGQGDVVGEMGLLRSVPRSATVIAADEGELLLISWKIIQRLQWLYPPIAHKFFHNLMNIICDRLEQSNRCLTELKCADDLTGLCNRNEFERIIEIEMDRSRRYGSALAVCMVRLLFSESEDWEREKCSLKRIEAAARQLSGQLRKIDTICRYDVHTFAILMPEIDLDSAFGVCARLQEVIRAEAGDDKPFTTAHCIATLSGHSDGPSSLLSRAEALLSLT